MVGLCNFGFFVRVTTYQFRAFDLRRAREDVKILVDTVCRACAAVCDVILV